MSESKSDWERLFVEKGKNDLKERFCKNMIDDFKDVDKEDVMNNCIENPLQFLKKYYQVEIDVFKSLGFEFYPEELLFKCEETKELINFIKDKDKNIENMLGKEKKYKINYYEGIKSAIENLKKYSSSKIDILDYKEKNQNFKVIEHCLPTESYIIEKKGSSPDGVTKINKLKSPFSEMVITPSSMAVIHEFLPIEKIKRKHTKVRKKKKKEHKHLEGEAKKEYFNELLIQSRITEDKNE